MNVRLPVCLPLCPNFPFYRGKGMLDEGPLRPLQRPSVRVRSRSGCRARPPTPCGGAGQQRIAQSVSGGGGCCSHPPPGTMRRVPQRAVARLPLCPPASGRRPSNSGPGLNHPALGEPEARTCLSWVRGSG